MNAGFIVCEKKGDWAAALRWAQRDGKMRIHELRSLIDCRNELRSAPASVLALETNASNIEGVLRLMIEMQSSSPQARVIILADVNVQRWEELLREAGAIHVVYSTRRLEQIIAAARQRIAKVQRSNRTLREAIWSRLPWAE